VARFSISCCMMALVESMDRLVSRYQCNSPVRGGGSRWRIRLGRGL
jgi:hypothetical protein